MTQSKPKALFVYSDRHCSCTAKRCFEVINGLWRYQRDNIHADAIHYSHLKAEHFQKYSHILFQRLGGNGEIIPEKNKKQILEWISLHTTCKTVFDIDDLVLTQQNNFPIELTKACSIALAPNPFLQRELQRYNKCALIHTHVDIDAIDAVPTEKQADSAIHIGWFSSQPNGFDYLKPILADFLSQNQNVVLHIYCDVLFHHLFQGTLPQSSYRLNPLLAPTEMYRQMKAMDILINPLDNAFFYQGKSEIKYALAGACSIPLIVTSTDTYKEAIQHNYNGLLATSPSDWLDGLQDLSKNPEKSRTIGRTARADVEKNYSLKRAACDYLKLFQSL